MATPHVHHHCPPREPGGEAFPKDPEPIPQSSDHRILGPWTASKSPWVPGDAVPRNPGCRWHPPRPRTGREHPTRAPLGSAYQRDSWTCAGRSFLNSLHANLTPPAKERLRGVGSHGPGRPRHRNAHCGQPGQAGGVNRKEIPGLGRGVSRKATVGRTINAWRSTRASSQGRLPYGR